MQTFRAFAADSSHVYRHYRIALGLQTDLDSSDVIPSAGQYTVREADTLLPVNALKSVTVMTMILILLRAYLDRFGTCLRPRGTVDSCTVARCTRFYNYHNSAKTTISLLHVAQESFNSFTTITTVHGVRKVLMLIKLTECVT